MKFIVFSDQHLEKRLANIPELEQDNKDLFKLVVDKAIELDVDYLVSVGDMFDNNKPTSDTIKFVSSQVARLKPGTALALAGDHSKPINNATWEHVCGFSPINNAAMFVGVDYSDNPADVIHSINHELRSRKKDSVRFIFMHQQVPELWPFCEEKKKVSLKDLDFSNQCASLEAIFLGDIHIRRSVKYWDVNCNKDLFVGYCGSLGVTATNEIEKPGLYYYANNTLSYIDYSLPRRYVTLDVTEQSLPELSDASKYADYKSDKKRPVFIVKLYDDVNPENNLNFLNDIGYVRTSKVKKDKEGKEEMINIRSELKTAERFSEVLKQLTKDLENAKKIYDISYELLTTHDIKTVLDAFKQTAITH